jgi:hypothetical protein
MAARFTAFLTLFDPGQTNLKLSDRLEKIMTKLFRNRTAEAVILPKEGL